MFVCYRWWFNFKYAMHRDGVGEGVHGSTRNGVQCVFKVCCVPSLVGMLFYIIGVIKEIPPDAPMKRFCIKQTSARMISAKVDDVLTTKFLCPFSSSCRLAT